MYIVSKAELDIQVNSFVFPVLPASRRRRRQGWCSTSGKHGEEKKRRHCNAINLLN